jgi:hypothetical protein
MQARQHAAAASCIFESVTQVNRHAPNHRGDHEVDERGERKEEEGRRPGVQLHGRVQDGGVGQRRDCGRRDIRCNLRDLATQTAVRLGTARRIYTSRAHAGRTT